LREGYSCCLLFLHRISITSEMCINVEAIR
jgi:hypothetical protein